VYTNTIQRVSFTLKYNPEGINTSKYNPEGFISFKKTIQRVK
jgi:hypothetical protein